MIGKGLESLIPKKNKARKKKMNQLRILSFGLRLIKSSLILFSQEKSLKKKRLIL